MWPISTASGCAWTAPEGKPSDGSDHESQSRDGGELAVQKETP